MFQDNLGLTIGRAGQVVGLEHLWNLVFITKNIIDFNLYYRGGEVLFPLYLYKGKSIKKVHIQSMILFEPEAKYESKDKIPNIDKAFYEKLNKIYKKNLTPEEILYYIYAVFYSNIYREKYSEFLKIDFPRVPFTADYGIFGKMARLGNQLVDLHLMKSEMLDNPVSRFYGDSENDRIGKVVYIEKERRIYINEEKYFDNISPELWNYQIGGYQVLRKYLKDRKGRIMEDSRFFCRIIMAINKTVELQKQIDEIYQEVEKELIEF